jgi:hypothetical protein
LSALHLTLEIALLFLHLELKSSFFRRRCSLVRFFLACSSAVLAASSAAMASA